MTLDHLPRGIGALLLLLALALLAGIALDAEALARWCPDFQGMGRNTLLAFALAGATLLAGSRQARWLGIAVVLMAAVVLIQYQFDFFPLDSRWQYFLNTLSDQPWPGRMSPPTAISFLAAGLALAWWPRVRGGAHLAALQVLLIVLLLPALISLSGYAMGMAVLTTRAPHIALLSLPTAVGLALLLIALQIQVSRGEGARDYFARYPDRYMLTVAAMLLLVLLLVGGLASSVLLEQQDLAALQAGGGVQADALRGNLWNIVFLDLGLAVLGALLLYRFMLPLARSLREARSNLSATLRHHQLILENVGDGIIGLDTQGRAIYLNDAAERLLGYPHEELRSNPVHGIVHHRRRDGTPYPREECPIFQTLQSGQPRRVDQDVFWRKDQQALEVEYACTPILEDGQVTGAVVIFRDMTERHREAAALSRWQHIFEHAEWGMVVCSADSQNLEDVNPAFARMHGYNVGELSGCPIVNVFAPEYRAELPERIRLAHEQGHHLWESWHLRRDGSRFPVQIDVTAVKDEAGQVLYRVVNVQDISVQRAREDQLRRSEATMRLMLEHLPVGVWLADAQGSIVYGNPAGQEVWRGAKYVPTEEFHVYEAWWADTGKKIETHEWALARAIEKGETSLNEVLDIRCFDGSRKTILNSALPLFDSEGHFEGAIVINQDITEARRAEIALREREASLAQAQAQAHLGSWRLDIPSSVLAWSDESYRIFGMAVGTPQSYESFLACVHPDDRLYVDRAWHAGMRGESYDIQHRLLVNGQVKWVRERADLEFGEDGSLLRGVGTIQDITELKHHEDELLRSRQELRELAAHHEKIREAERARIAREIHDELGQYLTALRMDTAMLNIQFGSDKPELARHVTGMKETIDATIGVVRNLASALRPAALDMGLGSAAEWLLAGFQDRTGIRTRLEMPEGEDLKLDDDRATAAFRILQESLTNITRHARATSVCVRIERRDALEIEVCDNGVGFDPAEVRLRKTFGLMSIRERALMFGGESRIDSTPGAGTTLRVAIPLPQIS